MKIVICEPQCWGFEHALFNAALLETILLAYPQADIYYLSEKTHWEWVISYLSGVSGSRLERVEWIGIEIPEPDYEHWGRLTLSGYREESHWYLQAQQVTDEQNAGLLVITSTTTSGLLAVKKSMYFNKSTIPTIVIPHSILALILNKHPLKRLRSNLLGFRSILAMPQPENLLYIALGGSIHRILEENEPGLAPYFSILDPPYLWSDQMGINVTRDTNLIRFGYLGVGAKGFDMYARLASEIQPKISNAEFILVGFLNTPQDPSLYEGNVKGVSEEPLSAEEFTLRAASLTYAVWFADPERYRLAASVSFLDALSYGKPGIYLRNPFIEYYFEKMGDIGYLCDTYEEVYEVTTSILSNFPEERYQMQCENILRERRIFEPGTLAPQFRSIGRELNL
jgi:hypothetical protein